MICLAATVFRRAAVFLGVALVLSAAPNEIAAQSANRAQIVSPILTVDSERLYLESAFGQRVIRDVQEQEAALAAENEQIRIALEEEELALTEMRETMNPQDFRSLADEFDEKVQSIRSAQVAKSRELGEQVERNRAAFLTAAGPVLERLMRETGAAVILEQRTVFISANAIDVTNEAITRIDAVLGEGEPLQGSSD